MGFWQNKNGQGIIYSCGGTGLPTFLTSYNPFKDLSATATPSQVTNYVYTTIKAANASGASMNAMLKAQMLATALDVYFTATGTANTCSKLRAANLGGQKIDLTKVCKMIDSSSGTATCSGIPLNTSSAFGGLACPNSTVNALLSYAASQSNVGGTLWYGNNVKATQELAKNTFDAINNGAAILCAP